MSIEKLDRLYSQMMAENEDIQYHEDQIARKRARLQQLADEIKAECAAQKRANALNDTLRNIALSQMAPLERV